MRKAGTAFLILLLIVVFVMAGFVLCRHQKALETLEKRIELLESQETPAAGFLVPAQIGQSVKNLQTSTNQAYSTLAETTEQRSKELEKIAADAMEALKPQAEKAAQNLDAAGKEAQKVVQESIQAASEELVSAAGVFLESVRRQIDAFNQNLKNTSASKTS